MSAFLDAPTVAVEPVFARHLHVHRLVREGWVHTFAVADGGHTSCGAESM
jgi:uncharacterized protein YbcC (UPF0753/DUF2309 family)